jgi:hypothetical protein
MNSNENINKFPLKLKFKHRYDQLLTEKANELQNDGKLLN